MNQFLNKITQGMKMGSNVFSQRLAQQRMYLANQFLRQKFSQQAQNNTDMTAKAEKPFENEFEFKQKKSYRFWMAGLIPLFMYLEDQRRKNEQMNCFFGSSTKYQRNRISGRIASSEYNANDPIEDRHHCKQLKNIDAYVCAVFDGHGGWAVSEYAKNLLIDELDFQLEQLKKKKKYTNEDEYISEALTKTFEYIETSFYEIALAGKVAKPFNVGSCALVTLIKDNKVYTANIGDCKGVILTEEKNEFKARKINHKLNANSKKEQARLKAEFPKDDNIVVCKRNDNTACYVKGRLMPTKAFGDYHLKLQKHFTGKGQWTGPYITAKPQILIHELQKNDRYIVMASDGLWDEMNKATIAQVSYGQKDDKTKIVSELFNTALLHAANEHKMTVQQLSNVEPGDRRRIHDDITIVCVDLGQQYKK